MKTEEKIVLATDPEAARFVTGISGWVDRGGRFWGDDERMARWCGSTHTQCECGNIYRRDSWCMPCHERKSIMRYTDMPRKRWDGTGMLYSDAADEWFSEWEEVMEYCENHECTIESLRLIICEPVYAREIQDDYWEEELPEDMGLSDCDEELARLVDQVNEYIRRKEVVLSWQPGEYAVELKEVETDKCETS